MACRAPSSHTRMRAAAAARQPDLPAVKSCCCCTMGSAGRVLLGEVNQAVLALQAAVDASTPRSPSLRAYVQ
eukprot:2070-Alexandrium_andersonii.AAC.1